MVLSLPRDSANGVRHVQHSERSQTPISRVSVVFYYEFSRQRTDVLIYFFPSEITNAEHLPSGHLIEPTAA